MIKTLLKRILKYDEMLTKLAELEQRIVVLEEENVSTTNELYRIENSIEARIDILTETL